MRYPMISTAATKCFLLCLVMFGFSDLALACGSTNATCDSAIVLDEIDLEGDTHCLGGCADGLIVGGLIKMRVVVALLLGQVCTALRQVPLIEYLILN